MQNKKNVFVIYGGYSNEADVSIRSGKNIVANLDITIFNVYEVSFINKKLYCFFEGNIYDIDLNAFSFILNENKICPDYCFIAIHGTPGEDGKLQSLFELIDIPYYSVNSSISSLTNNKYQTVCYAKSNGIKVADNFYINSNTFDIDNICANINFPFFIKACKNGSSIGVSKVNSKEDAINKIEETFKLDNEIIIEKAIIGREFTMAIFKLNNKLVLTSPSEELLSQNNIDFLSHENKVDFRKNVTQTVALLDHNIILKMNLFIKKIYNIFGNRGVMRIDFILNKEDNQLYLLEINTIPGMSPQSIFPKMVESLGIRFCDYLTQTIFDGINSKE